MVFVVNSLYFFWEVNALFICKPSINQGFNRKAADELKMMSNYDYAVVNDKVPLAVERIEEIIKSEHLRVARVMDRYMAMLADTGLAD